MAKLILSLDGTVLKEHELSKERTTIGRKPYNDIQIDNLAISGEHAVVITILNDSFLQDLDSTNGTQVNGRPVKKHFLQDNDLIEMAKYKIQYLTSSASVTNEKYQPTLVLRSGADEAGKEASEALDETKKIEEKSIAQPQKPGDATEKLQSAGSGFVASRSEAHAADKPLGATGFAKAEEAAGEKAKATGTGFQSGIFTGVQSGVQGGAQKPATPTGLQKPAGTRTGFQGSAGIQFLTGPNAGREIEITKNLTTLGKPGSHLAVIARRKNGYFLTHVEGDAFPSVNGKALDAKAHPLSNHDILELAGVKMEFFINS